MHGMYNYLQNYVILHNNTYMHAHFVLAMYYQLDAAGSSQKSSKVFAAAKSLDDTEFPVSVAI